MPSPHVLFTFLLFGCAGGSFDSGTADSDADADTAADPDPVPLDPCDPAAVFTGAVEGTRWVGEDARLTFSNPERGRWSDGCYGGYIEDTLTVEGTTFDWTARIYVIARFSSPVVKGDLPSSSSSDMLRS